MKIKSLLLLVLSAAVSFSACFDGKKKKSDKIPNQVEFIKISIDDYEISIPRDMQRTTGLNSDA